VLRIRTGEGVVVYLFHGEDTVACEEALAEIQREAVPADLLDLALTRLEGEGLSVGTLIEHCDALPFLSPKRLVIVERLAAQITKSGGRSSSFYKGLQEYLPRMAQTTILILRERDRLPRKHPLISLIDEVGRVREFTPPRGRKLAAWIGQQVRREGAEITPAAANLLAATVGTESAILLREIEKLVTYVGPEGKIEERLVAELSSDAQLDNIFDLVDAIGLRRRGRALVELQRLFQAGQHPLYILAMVVRQFRLLLQVKGLPSGDRRPDQAARTLKIHPFVAEKVVSQARLFRAGELSRVYGRLVETDREIKTGQRDAEVALELLVVEVTG
jgi:DNA polymerase-3 subunit delta